MAADIALNAEVAEFLYREALYLDEQRWEDWLGLYAEDAVFWVPSYTMRGELVTDPELSVNLIYIDSRAGLEDRIFRLETGDSLASTPVPRTCHMIGNVLAEAGGGDGGVGGDDTVAATATFQVSSWAFKRGTESRCGRYEYTLCRQRGDFRIARKKVVTIDEVVDGWFDVFSI